MYFAQHYLECLSHASYLVGDRSSGRAIVVDPRRDVEVYLTDARAHGLQIVGVINTHVHADFLSGHLELAAATGAWIAYGPRAETDYATRTVTEGQRISLGEVVLQVMETPGHTPESISLLVFERGRDEVPYGVLTGDALFIGDVGRPDLLVSFGVEIADLGRQLYDSIHRKLLSLPNPVRVFPAHGAGSACGKNLSTARSSTIGEQRLTNYACRPMTQERFIALVSAGQPPVPDYFRQNTVLNRRDRAVLDPTQSVPTLDPVSLLDVLAAGGVLLDAREPQEFAAGHVVGALNVPADGRFAETAGALVSRRQELVLLAPEGREQELALRLARIGLEPVVGYVHEPEAALVKLAERVQQASRVTAPELAELLGAPHDPATSPTVWILDVRTEAERSSSEDIPGSVPMQLAEVPRRLADIPFDRPVVVYCPTGRRSSAVASALRRAGHPDVSDVIGGYAAWHSVHEPADLPVVLG